jgi:hypothetical protein
MADPAPWLVAIPTYRRAATLADKTIPALLAARIPPGRIHIYLSDPAERDAYTAALPAGGYAAIHDGQPTLAGNRNHIMRRHPAGQRIVFCDDDIVRISRRERADQLRQVEDLPPEIDQAFRLAGQAGARLWGIYPVTNAFFMKPRVRTDLCYIIGCFYGITVAGDDADLVTLEDKEDYERTLRCYDTDGAVLRVEWLAPETRYYTEPGGMQETRTEQRVAASARDLVRRYPHLATYYRAKSGHAELRLKDIRRRRRRVKAAR